MERQAGKREMQTTPVVVTNPPVPDLSFSPKNFDAVAESIQTNYQPAWDAAHVKIGGIRDSLGVTGIVGRVEANLSRISKLDAKSQPSNALKATTHQQIDDDIKKTNDFLKRWGKTPVEKANAKELATHWDEKLGVNSGPFQDENYSVEYERARAHSVNGVWHDIQVMEAHRQAINLRKTTIATESKAGLPKLK